MTDTSTDLVPAGVGGGIDGMEDIEASDLVMPILKMDHEALQYVSSVGGEPFTEAKVIVLGVVKQRILWPADPGQPGELPICRSYDHDTGIPNPETFIKITKKLSGFEPERIEEGALPCENCNLANWGTHPKADGSWCNEQYTLPLLLVPDEDDAQPFPALLSFQRSGIKPVRGLITAFQGRKRPFYTQVVTLGFVVGTKGSKKYMIPKFTLGDSTDPALWPEYSKTLHSIRSFITTPRTRAGDDEGAPSEDAPAAAASASTVADEVAADAGATAPAAGRANAAPKPSPVDLDEEPF